MASVNRGLIKQILADSEGELVEFSFGNVPVIDVPHLRTHQGVFFTAGHSVLALANGASIDIFLRPFGRAIHLQPSVAIGGDGELLVYETPSWTPFTGTTLTNSNHNRVSTLTSGVEFQEGATFTNAGTLLAGTLLPGGQKKSAIGTGASFDEWVLNNFRHYMFRLFNRSGAAQVATLSLSWYEPSLLA